MDRRQGGSPLVGTAGLCATVCEMDVRPGGAWRRRMRAPDGTVITKWGVYREVVVPERLVFTYRTESAGVSDSETLVTVTFADLGTRTRLTLRHTAFATDAARVGTRAAGPASLERLVTFIATDGAGAGEQDAIGAPHDTLAAHVSRGPCPAWWRWSAGAARPMSRRSAGSHSRATPRCGANDLPYRLHDQADHGGATLLLVEQCKLRLDDPVDEFLPELANRRVLKSLEGPVR